MKTTLFAASFAATIVSVLAQDDGGACLPTNSSGFPDLDAPCNALGLIELECLYGPAAGLAYFSYIETNPEDSVSKRQSSNFTEAEQDPPEQDFSSQRNCVCSSQFFQLAVACDDCLVKHAYASESTLANATQVYASISSAYCAASSTPTLDLFDFLSNAVPDDSPDGPGGPSTSSSSTASDPYSGNTAVSVYYTPAVTGSALWAVPTETILSTIVTESSTIIQASVPGIKTSNGQIVPTVGAALAVSSSQGASSSVTTGSVSGSPSGSTAKPSSSTHSGGAAAPTQAVAAAGMLGFVAAAIALL